MLWFDQHHHIDELLFVAIGALAADFSRWIGLFGIFLGLLLIGLR